MFNLYNYWYSSASILMSPYEFCCYVVRVECVESIDVLLDHSNCVMT